MLRDIKASAQITDEDHFFKLRFANKYSEYLTFTTNIEQELAQAKNISGGVIMTTFNLPAGPIIGRIIKFIRERFPQATILEPEIITAISSEFGLDVSA